MRDIFFQELRECNRNIKEIKDIVKKKQGYEMLCKTVEIIRELSSVARHEGLISLESAAYDIEKLPNKDFLSSIIRLIVDGTRPELVEELSTAKYFARGVEGFEALQYLLMMFGGLAIQDGEHPLIIEEKLLSLVPMGVVNRYKQKQKENNIKTEINKESDISYLEKFYEGEIAVECGDEYYFQLKIVDYALRSLDDMSTQRFLRDVDFIDLALVLRGVSGAARKQVLSNLSPRVAVMITEDMEFMGDVELCDVADACLKALHILLLLVKRAEIVCSDAEAMATFGKIFDIAADIKRDRKIENEELEIYKIMRDYKLASHRTIKPTWKIVE